MTAKHTTKQQVIDALKECLDPELGVDVWTLGFIYGLELDRAGRRLGVKMTLSSPLCPYGPQMVEDVRRRLEKLPLDKIDIDLVFEPPWQPPEGLREMLGV